MKTTRLIIAASIVLAAGCSEPVGRSKTTSKQTVDTPTGKTTVTETREKSTTIDPR
jgi:hypothetical protein